MSALTRLRRFWLDVHLWIGIALFIPFVILGLTGSVLVFHDELDRIVSPQRYQVSAQAPLPLADLLERGQAEIGPRFVVTGVRPPDGEDAPAIVQARAKGRTPEGQRPETRSIFLDPATGAVRDIANTRADAFGILHQLHGSLMIPENGRKIVGWMGWAMLISSLTGIWLWWPRNGALLAGLRWGRTPRTTTNLHHVMGFWLAIPLALLSLTGVYISFPQMSRGVLAHIISLPESGPRGQGGGPPGGGPPPINAPHLSADAAARAALSVAAPGATLIAVNLPTRGRDGAPPNWRVQIKAPDAEATRTIEISDADGAVARNASPSPDQNVARLMRRLHDGTDFGLVWRTIIFFTGLAPAVLGVTGIVIWLRRRAARRALRRGHAASPEPALAAE